MIFEIFSTVVLTQPQQAPRVGIYCGYSFKEKSDLVYAQADDGEWDFEYANDDEIDTLRNADGSAQFGDIRKFEYLTVPSDKILEQNEAEFQKQINKYKHLLNEK